MTGDAAIYTLCDPRDGSIHYVGKTSQPLRRRLSQHIQSANRGRRWLSAIWVRSLIAGGVVPTIHLLEAVSVERWEDAEREWIAKLALAGHPLKNASEGGDGPTGFRHSAEARAKIAAAGTGRRPTEETLAKLRARIYPSDWGERISRAKKGRVVISEAQREAARVAQTGRRQSDEQRRAQSERVKKQWADGRGNMIGLRNVHR